MVNENTNFICSTHDTAVNRGIRSPHKSLEVCYLMFVRASLAYEPITYKQLCIRSCENNFEVVLMVASSNRLYHGGIGLNQY